MIQESKRELTKKKRREHIIDSAEKIFFSKGIDQCTMEEITDEAGLSRRTLYSYFNSKEHIIYEIKTRGFRKLISMLEATVNDTSENNEFNRIRNLLMSVLKFQTEYRDYCLVMKRYSNQLLEFENQKDANEASNCYEVRGIAIQYIEKALTTCKIAGLIRAEIDTLDTAIIISGTYSGILNTLHECETTICCTIKNPKELIEQAMSHIFTSISLEVKEELTLNIS